MWPHGRNGRLAKMPCHWHTPTLGCYYSYQPSDPSPDRPCCM